jgi:hypothetical protein
MRNICSPLAGERNNSDPANASAQHERRVVMAFLPLAAQVVIVMTRFAGIILPKFKQKQCQIHGTGAGKGASPGGG